jgi:CDP-glucose 4,6-dehydratase
MRGAAAGAVIPIRRPDAVRPWQHVLNPLSGYLVVAQALASGDAAARDAAAGGWNFGPADDDVRPVSWIVERLSAVWPGDPLRWEIDPGPHPHEAGFLSLDSSKARAQLGWTPRWDLEETLAAIVEWHSGVSGGADPRALTLAQIERFAGAGGA